MKEDRVSGGPILDISDLSVRYEIRKGSVDAVRHVSLCVNEQEAFGLVGESGCGKSTVAFSVVNSLGRNGRIAGGQILFRGRDLVSTPEEELRDLRGNQISMVFQDPMQSLNPCLRLGDQLSEVLIVHQKMDKRKAFSASADMLRRVYMPDAELMMQRYPHQLSGGQQQRAIIAMAMLNQPSLLLMDEPTTALDVTVEAAVLDLIDDLRHAYGTAVLYITHNLGVVARVCDRVGVMYAGTMVEQAGVQEIFLNPAHPYTKALISCVPRLGSTKMTSYLTPIRGSVPFPGKLPPGCPFEPRCDFAQDICRQRPPDAREVSAGHAVRCHFAEQVAATKVASRPVTGPVCSQRSDAGTAPILDVKRLTAEYQQGHGSLASVLGLAPKRVVRAVDEATFELPKGCTLGIVGESGCGKSTLARTVIGLQPPAKGDMEFLGVDVTEPITKRDLRLIRQMQMVFQNPDSTLNPAFSIGKQVGRSLVQLRGMKSSKEVRSEVMELLRSVRLNESYYDRRPRQLSGGEKQRVAIARAIAAHPELVICDEPVSALDVSVQAAVLTLLLELQRETGITMMLISHDLSVVRYCSEYVAVMYMGQLVDWGPVEAIYAPPYHPYTESLLASVPVPDPNMRRRRILLEGTVPSLLNPPTGCRFHTRCPRRAMAPEGGSICATQAPPSIDAGNGHHILCHIPLSVLKTVDPVIHTTMSTQEA